MPPIRTLAPAALLGAMGLAASAPLTAAPPPGFVAETVISGLEQPIALAFLPDGRLLTAGKAGTIWITDVAASPAAAEPYLTLTDIAADFERGLLDLAIDPEFGTTRAVYALYSHGTTGRLRVARFTHADRTADPDSEVVVWQSPEITVSCCHVGGGLDFGPDGRLYVTTGDAFDAPQAQSLKRIGGKILRLDPDGSIPKDNPFHDGSGPHLDEIWAIGLRNPFRIRWDHPTGRLFIADVGGNDHATAHEDLHLGAPGANYGWPLCEGPCDNPSFPDCACGVHDDPLHTYAHRGTVGSIIGGFVYRGGPFPDEYDGVYFFADFARRWIRGLRFAPNGAPRETIEFEPEAGLVVALDQGPDGAVYFVDHLGAVGRISYVGDDPCPADLDGNGVVSMTDLNLLLTHWGSCPADEPCPQDLDDSGEVSMADIDLILAAWGPC